MCIKTSVYSAWPFPPICFWSGSLILQLQDLSGTWFCPEGREGCGTSLHLHLGARKQNSRPEAEKPDSNKPGYMADGVQSPSFIFFEIFWDFSAFWTFCKIVGVCFYKRVVSSHLVQREKPLLVFCCSSLVKINLRKFGLDKRPISLATQLLDPLQTIPRSLNTSSPSFLSVLLQNRGQIVNAAYFGAFLSCCRHVGAFIMWGN